jgi:hypothetical protein
MIRHWQWQSRLLSIFISAALGCAHAFAAESFRTTYETSGYTSTGNYDECVACCNRLARGADGVSYRAFGNSAEGRELPLLLVDRAGHDAPLLMVLAGIHAGEIDGKDAGLLLLRDLLIDGKDSALLRHVRLAFIPILNVDGHERRSAFTRINQNGPRESGWRTTAENLNLNRDFMKADAVEMQALHALIRELNPDMLVDIHVTDGADYSYVLTYSMNDQANEWPAMRHYNHDVFLPEITRRLGAAGYEFVPQVSLKDELHVERGWMVDVLEPRFSTGYGTVINRPSLLLETHSLKDYRTRVTGTYEFLHACLVTVGAQATELKETVNECERVSVSLPGRPYHLNWTVSGDSELVDFAGYEYQVGYSPLLGDSIVRWTHVPHTYRIPRFDHAVPRDTITVPYAYLIPPAWLARVSPVLAVQGIIVRVLSQPCTLDVEAATFTDVKWAERSYQGRQLMSFATSRLPITAVFPRGSGLITLDQPRSQIAVHLLEPDGPDSFVRWGFLNPIFEQVEYAEAYVLDTLAAAMLRSDSVLAAEFSARLADSTFANNSAVRVQYFYEHSPYWDSRKDRYPVGRIVDPAVLSQALTATAARSKRPARVD